MNNKECPTDLKRILSSLVINKEKEAREHLYTDEFSPLLCLPALLTFKYQKQSIDTVENVTKR